MRSIYSTDFMDRDPYFAMGRGAVEGVDFVHKFGRNAAVGAALETIWSAGGLYSYLTAATVLKVSSGDVDDTIAGAGARTVELQGLDASYLPITELVKLNGQTAVNTKKLFLRIFRMRALTAGASGKNEGIIYAGTGNITTGVPDNIYAQIDAGLSQTLMALYTIPAGMQGCISLHRQHSSISKVIVSHMCVRAPGEIFQVKDVIPYTEGEVNTEFRPALPVGERSDIEIRALATGGGGDIGASFTVWLSRPEGARIHENLPGVLK